MNREKRLEESLVSLAEILLTEAQQLSEMSDRKIELSRQIIDVVKNNAVISTTYKWDIGKRDS
jgi:hypothetical protein